MALLYKEKCRDFMNDITIDKVSSMIQSPDIHHIFPEAYCVKENIKRQKYNSIVNKTPILPETNRSIGGNAPSVYTKGILKKVQGLTEEELRARIESHLVNYTALVADDFASFGIVRHKNAVSLHGCRTKYCLEAIGKVHCIPEAVQPFPGRFDCCVLLEAGAFPAVYRKTLVDLFAHI